MKEPTITVYTNDKNLWLLNGFQLLFRKYWSTQRKVRIVGYTPPKANLVLEENFYFHSIDRRNYPASEWSNGVIQSLDKFIADGEEFMILMLEDYWITTDVAMNVIDELTAYMHRQPRNILRIDLTADRCQHRQFIVKEQKLDTCTLIQTKADCPYQMSFQAGIWNVKLLRQVLRPYEDPWQSEIFGSQRLQQDGDKYVVLGTRDCPLRYQPVYRSKRVSIDISKLSSDDQQLILRRGYI